MLVLPEVEYWNSIHNVTKFNCYNYATDDDAIRFKQPGNSYDHDSCITTSKGEYHKTKFRYAALQDGLRPVPKNGVVPEGWHLVYYCFSTGWDSDYHWYKKDMVTGIWSHKRGNREATFNERYSSCHILNPIEDAKEYGYTKFGGYLIAKTYKITEDQ